MLEWYRPGADMAALIDETEALLRAVLPPVVTCRGITDRPGAVRAADRGGGFARYAGADVLAHRGRRRGAGGAGRRARCATARTGRICSSACCWSAIEPHLGRDHPTFLTHWPAAQAALARRDPADPRVAERFELFVCGIELANAFVELTDAAEQRARFVADRARRHALYGPDWPLDEDFLAALAAAAALRRHRAGLRPAGDAGDRRRASEVLWLPT